jgi:hypothetical protein
MAMTEQQPPALTPEQTAARTLPPQNPLHDLSYEPLMTRIQAAKLKPVFKGLAIAVGVMALGNVVMFALVQKAQQETVELAARIASNGGDGALGEGSDAASDRMAIFAPLAEMIESIKEKERRRDALLAQNPAYAGALPIANAPDWRGQAALQLRAYDDQIDAQLAILARNADVASADSIAPSSLDAPKPALALPLPAPSIARAAPAPVQQAVKPAAAKPAAARRTAPQSAAAKRSSDSDYARELTAALNRAARAQAPVAAGSIDDAPATPAPMPVAAEATAAADTAPIATAAPIAPPAAAQASDDLGQ